MATKVHMEALSPTMEEGQIVRWLKAEGDAVTSGDILAEIETDKATMELVARGDGILRAVMIEAGGVAPVGSVIGVIAGADEDISDLVAGAGGGAAASEAPSEAATPDADSSKSQSDKDMGDEAAPATASQPAAEPAVTADSGSSVSSASSVPSGGSDGGRLKASPLARRLAADAGIDLSNVSGSGPGGRIVKKDVEDAKSAPVLRPHQRPRLQVDVQAPPAPEKWVDAGATEGFEEVRVSQMRKTIARRLTESLSPVPHFFLTVEIDMTRIMEARKSINAVLEKDGDKISVNDFIIRGVGSALMKHPNCNAAWHGDVIRRFGHVHVGVAVAVEDGLITPVIKFADRKGLVQISREVKELAGRARQKKLQPDEYMGSTFSISNLGMFGIKEFTAIINPPEAGILAIGATEEIPVVVDGQVVIRPRMRVTMSCDHRVIDGAQGSQFLGTLKAMLEEPTAMLV